MKIVVGLHGGVREPDIRDLAAAGADEFFLGYVPGDWWEHVGFEVSPNRRYRPGNSFTDRGAMEAAVATARSLGKSVSITFNEHHVTEWAFERGLGIISHAMNAGVSAVIVADPSVVGPVSAAFPSLAIHASGDMGAGNRHAVDLLFSLGVSRVIFPREIALDDIAAIRAQTAGAGREFEAFVMGEPCVFDGSRCFTEHGYGFSCDFCNAHTVRLAAPRSGGHARPLEPRHGSLASDPSLSRIWSLGRCGLCAVPALRAAGVTHVKVPGRASDALENTRLVAAMIKDPASTPESARALLAAPEVCKSGTFCYYKLDVKYNTTGNNKLK
jgi:collagenase-like PrtC family protease